jgi:tetratricopeptide (TPR) repeat protein
VEGDLHDQRLGMAGFLGVMAPAYWAWALAEQGTFGDAIAECEKACRLGEILDHAYSQGFPYWHLGYIYVLKGEPDAALRALDRAAVLTRGIDSLSVGVTWCRGYALAASAEGLKLLRETLTALERMEFGVLDALAEVHAGEACTFAGELREAQSHAERALALARDHHQRGYEAYALRLFGELAACSEPRDAEGAETLYREALALGEQLGMGPLPARCHFGLGILYNETGRRELAAKHLSTAARMFREMEMQNWFERAETAIGALA